MTLYAGPNVMAGAAAGAAAGDKPSSQHSPEAFLTPSDFWPLRLSQQPAVTGAKLAEFGAAFNA